MTAKNEGRLPEVTALRLVRAASRSGRPPSPPFGLASWSLAEDAPLAILLDTDGTNRDPLATVAARIPLADDLPPGSLVVVLGEADAPGGMLARVTRGKARVSRSTRATALLARGYARIGAAVDPESGQDLAWGYAIRSC